MTKATARLLRLLLIQNGEAEVLSYHAPSVSAMNTLIDHGIINVEKLETGNYRVTLLHTLKIR